MRTDYRLKPIILASLLIIAAFSCTRRIPAGPDTALQAYLDKAEPDYKWEIAEKVKSEGLSVVRIHFTSQKWRDILWNHELILLIPDKLEFSDALLFISGGSLKDGIPKAQDLGDGFNQALGRIAIANRALVASLRQVPNQPLFDDLTEDALISFTLHNYQNDKDLTWPLLFPMTKSAIKAMDVVQEYAEKELQAKIGSFVVSGASKRGWTTWLTGAHDKRVRAIAPMVIDVLNMPVNVDYQKVVWGDYSIEIQDYVRLGIAQQVNTPEGIDLVRMIDPYSYRKNLSMPKMIFMGTNDPYWPVDAVRNYIDSIPGLNYICYTPNAGHDLADGVVALPALSAFFGFTIAGEGYPVCDYTISESESMVSLRVRGSSGKIKGGALWYSDSEDQDFRDEKWTDSAMVSTDPSGFDVIVRKPASGYRAFYVDLRYQSPSGGDYTQSTRMFVADNKKLLVNRSN